MGNFKMKKLYTSTNLLLLLVIFFIISCGPTENEKKKILEQERLKEQQKIEEQNREQARLDTLKMYSATAEKEFNKKSISSAILYLDTALTYAIKEEKSKLITTRAFYSFQVKKYNEAINDYSTLIKQKINRKVNYYERALCYEKLKKRQEAVNDLKEAIVLNNKDAEKLHDKINPIKKKVSYYVTRCCDGTTSNAKGKGACSHHGGVCNWNDPIYEEYRKY